MRSNQALKYDIEADEREADSCIQGASSHQNTYEFLCSLKRLKVFLISLSWFTFIVCSVFFLVGCSKDKSSGAVPESFQSELDIARGDLRALGLPNEASGYFDPQTIRDTGVRPVDDLFKLTAKLIQYDLSRDSRYRTGVGRLSDLERDYSLFFHGLRGATNKPHGGDFFRPLFKKSGDMDTLYDGENTKWIDPFYFVDRYYATEDCQVERNEKERVGSADFDLIPKIFSIDLRSTCSKQTAYPAYPDGFKPSQGVPPVLKDDRLNDFDPGWNERVEMKAIAEDLSETDAFGAYRVFVSEYKSLQAKVKNYRYHPDVYQEVTETLGRGDLSEQSHFNYSYEVEKIERGVFSVSAYQISRKRETFQSEEKYFSIRDFVYKFRVRFPLLEKISEEDFLGLVSCVNVWDTDILRKAYNVIDQRYPSDDSEDLAAAQKIREIEACGLRLREVFQKFVIESASGFVRYYDKIRSKAFSINIDVVNTENGFFDGSYIERPCSGSVVIKDGEGNTTTQSFSRNEDSCVRSDVLFNGQGFKYKAEDFGDR